MPDPMSETPRLAGAQPERHALAASTIVTSLRDAAKARHDQRPTPGPSRRGPAHRPRPHPDPERALLPTTPTDPRRA
jgi:hypothetical protein